MYYFNRSILHKIKQDESFLDYRKYEIDEDYIDLVYQSDNIHDEVDLLNLYSSITGIPIYDYQLKLINLYNGVSIELMSEYECLVYVVDDYLVGLICNPYNSYNYNNLIVGANREIKLYLITKKEWEKYYNIANVMANEQNYSEYEVNNPIQLVKETSEIVYNEVSSAPIVQMVNHWIEKAIVLEASDIHFEPLEDKGIIRIRLDGKLKNMDEINIDSYDEVLTRIKVISSLDITKKIEPQDGKFILTVSDKKYDIRVSTIPTVLGEKIVLRILNHDELHVDFSNLNYTSEEEEKIKSLLTSSSGVILVTGPTGCGKTTTLYTYLMELVSEANNIVTVEDPVEYTIKGINQIQVNQMAGLTFASILRSILRQDPNIIMVGEIRDEETAQIAMRAAISGHLVLSTLHTNSAVGAITRLLDMGIPKYLVSSGISAIISQRLVRKLCPKCKNIIVSDNNEVLYEKRGCQHCYNTGYKGRILLSEILVLDDNLKEMISSGATERKMETYARKNKMITLSEKLDNAVKCGLTTKDEKLH